MTGRQDASQDVRDFWIGPNRFDDGIKGPERRIDLLAGSESPIGFRGVVCLEHFLWELNCPGYGRDAAVKLAIDEVGATAEEQSDRCDDTKIIAGIRPRKF